MGKGKPKTDFSIVKQMRGKGKSKDKENPEFERTKQAFKQIFSVPKEKLEELEKNQNPKESAKSKKDC